MDVEIREPTAGDAEAVGRMHHVAWREAYAHLLPDEVWQGDEAQKTAMWRRTLSTPGYDMTARIAVRDGRVVGLAAVGPATTEESAPPVRDRELWVLYALAAEHGTGLAADLLRAVLPDGGPAQLWVFEENPRARAFYGKHGFTEDGASHDPGPELGHRLELRMVR